jgi:hypothetical protein
VRPEPQAAFDGFAPPFVDDFANSKGRARPFRKHHGAVRPLLRTRHPPPFPAFVSQRRPFLVPIPSRLQLVANKNSVACAAFGVASAIALSCGGHRTVANDAGFTDSGLVDAGMSDAGLADANVADAGCGDAVIAIAPNSHDFGIACVNSNPCGQDPPPTTFTASSSGCEATGVLSAEVEGSGPSHFAIVGDSCSGNALQPGVTCSISVLFAPDDIGQGLANLQVSGSPGGNASATLMGSGGGCADQLVIAPTTWDFGSVALGHAPSTVFTLTNGGNMPIGPLNVCITGTGASLFNVTANGCNVSLQGQATCSVTVDFVPTLAAKVSATLSASGEPAGAAAYSVTIMGTGVAADGGMDGGRGAGDGG